jgi:hypothetical protein
LDQQVLQALPNFQSYLGGFSGTAVSVAHDQIKKVSKLSFKILRSDTISTRFIGTHDPISEDWPLKKPDPNGDKLIPECISKLQIAGLDMPNDFPTLRALAQAGKEALDEIVPFVESTSDLPTLITKTYSWTMFTGSYAPYAGK